MTDSVLTGTVNGDEAAPPPCATTPSQASSGNNGNVMGYFFQDNTSSPTPDLDHTATFTYDTLNRLTSSVATGNQTHNLDFSYDRWGNAKCDADGQTQGPCANWSFDTNKNQINDTNYTYDAAGNMLQDGTGTGTHTYQWDAEGRLVSIDGVAGQACQSTWAACFTYNALGQFVKRRDPTLSKNLYFYRYPSGDWAFMRTDTAVYEDYFLPVAGREFAVLGSYFVHLNKLGSATYLTNHTGAVTQKILYYPWGQQWVTAGTVTHVRFASMDQRQWGLDITPNRSYHPRLYRWLSG